MSTMRYFGVRLGNMVELRVAKNRPRSITSSLKKTLPSEKHIVWDFDTARYIMKDVSQTIALKQVYWSGGRILGSVKLTVFLAISGLRIKPDGLVEIGKDVAGTLLKERLF